jgi:hypothetical protein
MAVATVEGEVDRDAIQAATRFILEPVPHKLNADDRFTCAQAIFPVRIGLSPVTADMHLDEPATDVAFLATGEGRNRTASRGSQADGLNAKSSRPYSRSQSR